MEEISWSKGLLNYQTVYICQRKWQNRAQRAKKRGLKQRKNEGGLSRAETICVMANGPCAWLVHWMKRSPYVGVCVFLCVCVSLCSIAGGSAPLGPTGAECRAGSIRPRQMTTRPPQWLQHRLHLGNGPAQQHSKPQSTTMHPIKHDNRKCKHLHHACFIHEKKKICNYINDNLSKSNCRAHLGLLILFNSR